MKIITRQIFYFFLFPLFRIKFFKNIIKYLGNASKYYQQESICKSISKEKKVLSGPFKNLKYARFESAGSVLIPKIIGSYEDELNPAFEKIFQNKYSEILDIGSAEGYYSNGMAMRMPSAKVFAYDLDADARQLCKANAIANNLQSRIEINPFIDAAALATFPFNNKGLIICDCEGYEKELFTSVSVRNLANCDLIIELHDCNDDTISSTVLPLFSNTHQLTLLKSNPNKKIADYSWLNDHHLNDEDLNERNGIIQYWAFLEAIY